MITLHISRPDIAWLALSEWFDFLLMADAMGSSIALAFNESSLSLIADNTEVTKKLKALKYTDLTALWINVVAMSPSLGEILKELELEAILFSKEDFERQLNDQSWVITL